MVLVRSPIGDAAQATDECTHFLGWILFPDCPMWAMVVLGEVTVLILILGAAGVDLHV